MSRIVVRAESSRRPPEYRQMLRALFWIAYGVALCLAHIHLRMATRDMGIQAGRFQAQSEELGQRKNTLINEVARLRGGDRMLGYATHRLGLVALPADEIAMWKMPREIAEKTNRICSEIALGRSGEWRRTRPEPLVARVLGAVLSPVQAHSQNGER